MILLTFNEVFQSILSYFSDLKITLYELSAPFWDHVLITYTPILEILWALFKIFSFIIDQFLDSMITLYALSADFFLWNNFLIGTITDIYMPILDFILWDHHDSSGNRVGVCETRDAYLKDGIPIGENLYDIYETFRDCSLAHVMNGIILLFVFAPLIELIVFILFHWILALVHMIKQSFCSHSFAFPRNHEKWKEW